MAEGEVDLLKKMEDFALLDADQRLFHSYLRILESFNIQRLWIYRKVSCCRRRKDGLAEDPTYKWKPL